MTYYPTLIAVVFVTGIGSLIAGIVKKDWKLKAAGIFFLLFTVFIYFVIGAALNATNL